ncbi:AMP-binding protein [Streptomyces collinus]|uniref:AMP-binding protein n=1 Tax=Streptomyces collinus TaxID=42684 RepID=UPI002942C818|nr:AMP-binding protein [Streptomyces collinus]
MEGTTIAGPRPLAECFVDQARRTPEATALVWRGHAVGYGALLAGAEREHDRMAALPAGSPVALPAVKSPRTVALVLACLLARRPLLLPSPDLGADVVERLYAEAGVGHVLAPGRPPAARGSQGADLTGTALLLTTSGSTGVPKIVPLSGAALDRFVVWAGDAFGIGPGTTVLNYAPLNFDVCLLDVWTTLARGGRVVLVDTDRVTDGGRLLDLVERERPEVVQSVPMLYRLLADAARAGDRTAGGAAAAGRTLPSVRHAVFTGDTMPAPVLAALPGLLPRARLYNVYGCTETNDSFLYELSGAPDADHPLPLGRPLPGVAALLVDAEGRVLDGSGTGELYVSTPFQSDGYLGAAAASGAFGPHPEGADERRWFRSGDLVRRSADGTLTLVGRTDFQVKVRGVRVNPQEVEHLLLAHPDIAEAAVLAVPDPVAGRALRAVARRAPGSAVNSLSLRGHLARGLPRAAVPAGLLITDEPLPRTATGKVDRERAVRIHFTEES